MTTEQISGLIRTALATLVGYATAKGWVSAGMANEIVGLGGAVAVAAWSYLAKKDA